MAFSYIMLETRILIALAIIAGIVILGTIWGAGALRRHQRQRLRRRGIKTYGH